MAKLRKTQKEIDRMTPQNIERVIDLLDPKLEGAKPISKKDACQILGMSYNTSRLQQILDDYKQKKQRERELREQKRGKPADTQEIQYIIREYLTGVSIDQISRGTYRSSPFVKAILEKYQVPLRGTSHDYFRPELIPDGAVRSKFKLGEVVYSARYDSLCRIDHEQFTEKYGWIYRVWLLADKWQEYAYQENYELASLEHLRELGIKI